MLDQDVGLRRDLINARKNGIVLPLVSPGFAHWEDLALDLAKRVTLFEMEVTLKRNPFSVCDPFLPYIIIV